MDTQIKLYVHEESDTLFGIKGTQYKMLPFKDSSVKDALWIVGKLLGGESDGHSEQLPSWIKAKLATAHRYYLCKEDFESLIL